MECGGTAPLPRDKPQTVLEKLQGERKRLKGKGTGLRRTEERWGEFNGRDQGGQGGMIEDC